MTNTKSTPTYKCWNCGEQVAYGKPHACDVSATRHTKPLTADQKDGGARYEAQQNAGIDY